MAPVSFEHQPNAHNSDDLISLFNQCFAASTNTLLQGGANEPLYLPAGINDEAHGEHPNMHRVIFRADYFSSALHEVAHWCIAGEKRRLLLDFGYWYVPDGRDAEAQKAFEQVEIKPQALECAFSQACGIEFRVSVDNLHGEAGASAVFETAVQTQLDEYKQHGFPARAQQFLHALQHFYQTQRELVV